MSNLLDANLWVEAPPVVPYRFGLFSAVDPRPLDDPHWRLGVRWESDACGQLAAAFDPCLVEDVDALEPDPRCVIASFDPFTVYAFATDSLGSGDVDAKAVARLTNGEQHAAEAALWGLLTGAATPVDLSEHTPEVALGWVEQQIADVYGGLGVIHANRQTVTVLGDAVEREGSRLVTRLGTPVVAGGGYGSGLLIVGSGPIVMYRSAIETWSAPDRRTNSASTIASRTYLVGYDCTPVAAEFSLPTVSGAGVDGGGD